jgi:hypothetical protein
MEVTRAMNVGILGAENSTPVTAIIAAAGVVVGALLTAVAAAYSSRMKIQEIVFTYQQKLQDSYLENARSYTRTIYVPLSIAVYQLTRSYESFRGTIDFDTGKTSSDYKEVFEKEALSFLNQFDLLVERGAAAFLTSALEQRLADFTSFLRASLTADAVLKQSIFTLAGRKLEYSSNRGAMLRATLIDTAAAAVSSLSILAPMTGLPFPQVTREVRILSAPLTSREFEQRIITEMTTLNYLIKEVTLGSHSS